MSKIQKWGNSSAVRLPTKVLAAAGMTADSDIDIKAGDGCVVIQLKEKAQEQMFDQLFSEIPDAAELLSAVQKSLTNAISMTDEATKAVKTSHAELIKEK